MGALRRHPVRTGLAIFAMLVVFAIYWGWFRSPRLGDLQAEAEKFEPPAEWDLVDSEDVRRSPHCRAIGATCPRVYRRWSMPEPPTPAEFEELLKAAGWDSFEIDGDCRPKEGQTGSVGLCRAGGEANGLRVGIGVRGPHAEPNPFWLTLSVGP